MSLLPFQKEAVETASQHQRVAFYWEMGTGKTFVGAELLARYKNPVSLVICQKSKVQDWLDHFSTYYPSMPLFDLTSKPALEKWLRKGGVGVVNYDLLSRRPAFKSMSDHCLLLDESSLIQNTTAKRTKIVLSMAPKQVILLSGTPTGGHYEKLWSQMRLLGWRISKDQFWNKYIDYKIWDAMGFPLKIVVGYKNVPELRAKMRDYGAQFLKANEVMDELPTQTFIPVRIACSKEYVQMFRTGIAYMYGNELVGDTNLSWRMYLRQLATMNKECLLNDLLESTDERVIVFYNFQTEKSRAIQVCKSLSREISEVSGTAHDLEAYENIENSVTLVQYQAGAMGLNLQKARIAVFLSPPESSELYEQSKKRIHRIGQDKPCVYYQFIASESIEEKIYSALAVRKNYTDALFIHDYGCRKGL